MFLNKRYYYIFYSFVAGFSLMTVEIVSSRIISPIIGNSIYTWSSIIGITLLGLALGSASGGFLADKFNNKIILPVVFLASAIAVFLIPYLSQRTNWIINLYDSVLIINIVISIYLFLIPALIIGMIQPIVLKKYAQDFSHIGYQYGLLSTSWSLCSILGVFATGFYFVSTIGSANTIYIISSLLLILSILINFQEIREKKTLLISLLLLILISLNIYFQPNKKTG